MTEVNVIELDGLYFVVFKDEEKIRVRKVCDEEFSFEKCEDCPLSDDEIILYLIGEVISHEQEF